MNIPKGFKLVPGVATLEMKNAGWRECDRQGIEPESIEMQTIWTAMHLEAPAPPQPIYDEAKERELFEVHYRDLFETETGRSLSDDDIKSLRDGPFYGKSRTYLNGQWIGWQACAQSRAKAGEDE